MLIRCENCAALHEDSDHACPSDDVRCLQLRARVAELERLAAAAPDMARVLLAVEWGGQCRSYGSHCPSCLNYWSEGEKHEPDCLLDAALSGMRSRPRRIGQSSGQRNG